MAEKNQYFPHLFEPLKVGSKIVKNRIEAAPALFAFDHYIELDPDPFGYTTPVPERAFRMLEAKAKGGAGIVCLGELSPIMSMTNGFRLNRILILHPDPISSFKL